MSASRSAAPRIVHIDQRGASLEAQGQKLVVRVNGERRATLPLRLIDRVVVSAGASLTCDLLRRLAVAGAGVVIAPSRFGRGPAVHVLAGRHDGIRRMAQFEAARDEARTARLARALVTIKLSGQAALLGELGATDAARGIRLRRTSRRLERIARAMPADIPVVRLRGVEGSAARQFYAAYGCCFAPALEFAGRNRRPPRDPVNVCLSLGYTMAHHEALAAIASVGLDPVVGFLHELAAGRNSLACDLCEPLRPLVERWVHGLFAEEGLRAENFSTSDAGCQALKSARRLIYSSWHDGAAAGVAALAGQLARWIVAATGEGGASVAPTFAIATGGER